MTDQPDLAALRAAAHHEIQSAARRPLPGTWRTVRFDGLTAIAPTCTTDHRGRTPILPTVEGIYDCCPQPWIRVGYPAVTQLLLALLNPDGRVTERSPHTGPLSDDPTGIWT
ncbi:hypothetical protein F7Q99_36755 [Streptomyces kaniharaensis]|uniref:Uncharacterized protein n=1 Tax=Streptomyces kaniharaensis TaxID=212423 RepID=A0A6N7L172_9ACTN|nr:hypothetical protein [Streptomyces kaniharaensis]MQS17592.1 hypothetical protein [Streptomyces kaniharaensis]